MLMLSYFSSLGWRVLLRRERRAEPRHQPRRLVRPYRARRQRSRKALFSTCQLDRQCDLPGRRRSGSGRIPSSMWRSGTELLPAAATAGGLLAVSGLTRLIEYFIQKVNGGINL